MPVWLGKTRNDEARYDGAVPAAGPACRRMRERAALLGIERLAAAAASRVRKARQAGDMAAADRSAHDLAALRGAAHARTATRSRRPAVSDSVSTLAELESGSPP